MKKFSLPSILIITLCIACNSTEQKQPAAAPVVVHATEDDAIKKAVAEAYRIISFNKGEEPKYDSVPYFFTPQAQFYNFRNDTMEYFTIGQFTQAYKAFIQSSHIESFYEEEITGTTEQFGRIAHRISTYATYINTRDAATERGVNSFQLVKTNDGWKVSSIIWDVESPKLKIPDYYLKNDSTTAAH